MAHQLLSIESDKQEAMTRYILWDKARSSMIEYKSDYKSVYMVKDQTKRKLLALVVGNTLVRYWMIATFKKKGWIGAAARLFHWGAHY